MKITNKNINLLAEDILKIYAHSSSLEEKATQYFSKNPNKIGVFKENIDDAKELLKKGDALIHAMYVSCYDTNDLYIKKYNDTAFESIQSYILENGKSLKNVFKNNSDNSGIFDCKVAYVAQEVLSMGDLCENAETIQ